MAIIIRGKSKCMLCGRLLQQGQDIVSFSPFVGNELDPLWRFSDAAFHEACLREDGVAEEAQKRYEELKNRTAPGNRTCVVCKREITEPDDYFSLGHLTDDPGHLLYHYNYVQAHRSHLPEWPELTRLLKLLETFKQGGMWRGAALDHVIRELEDARKRAA